MQLKSQSTPSLNPPNQDESSEHKSARKALELALWYLSKSARTQKEIEDRLGRKEYSPDDIKYAIGRLKTLEFIDDAKYAESFIRNAKLGKPKGKHRIRLELIRKGVDKELIEQALEGGFGEDEQEELINSAAKSYLKKCASLPKEKIYNRLMGFLLRRGFDYDKVSRYVKALLKEQG